MRCDCCDVILTPQESVRRFKDSGEFTNTCSRCLRDIGVPTIEGRAYDDEVVEVDYLEDSGLLFDDDNLDEV